MIVTCEANFDYIVRGIVIEHNGDIRGFNVVITEPKPITNLAYLRELDEKLKEIFDVKRVTILEFKRYGW